ncbi:Phage integrase protein (plasmid) [Paraburkholderia caribensis MBA4]|uniref:Phage integrase protein n=1 Tax=Paraburkholderia caribensis MBA4 TaxID=1323664 RepID=A0A0P0RMK6_9BURK|nr:phage integrase family protein [Paraburkholderia caribensis]ALL70123.1 Phage integrase protein [Paraburkholderia caribensis MBA4]
MSVIDGEDSMAPVAAAGPDIEQLRKRIGLSHAAFFRAYLEGINVTDAADRYLDFGKHHMKARAAQRWILGRFLQAAQHFGRPGDVRVLRIPPDRISTADIGDGACFDVFSTTHDRGLILRTSDLIDRFRTKYPTEDEARMAARRQLRNVALRRRQFVILERLIPLVVENPEPGHHVFNWFDQSAGQSLVDVEIHTLEQLINAISGRGYRWWTLVPGLGETRARRIVAWLQANEKALGRSLTTAAVTPRRQWTSELVTAIPFREGIAPLVHFGVPVELNGERGAMRATESENLICARNDTEAVLFWLSRYDSKPDTTQRKYRLEVERLMLWSILQKGKALSSLGPDDANEYIYKFLPDPQPVERWIMATNEARDSSGWRPFRGPITPRGCDYTRRTLDVLFETLVKVGYLRLNVFALLRQSQPVDIQHADGAVGWASRARLQADRSLSAAHWDHLLAFVKALPVDVHGALRRADERLAFILILAYETGMRRAELAAARTGDIRRGFADETGESLSLTVAGYANRRREVPLPSPVIERLSRYLISRGLPASPL